MSRIIAASLAVLTTLPGLAAAEVLSASDTAFVARNRATIDAPPAKVWAQLVQPARWWSPAHSWSGDAANFSLDLRGGGCFCERLPNGGGVEHQRVVQVMPERLLRLSGGLGPLQAEALAAVMSWDLKADGERTVLTQTYKVGGTADGGLKGWAAPVDGVIREQFERLQRLIETGSPELPKPPPSTTP
ncbi:SRPBCC domain-containing protein [Nevskia sp.]|uniref:SRPBCC family protein n=1 Tax=Nevskia sp. TaxID=1929292 RepID=UPI002600C575|nr:SRPBCC domain-containing protein [Nevskia sp.]